MKVAHIKRKIHGLTDIIIPFHGQYHLLAECFGSLLRNTLTDPFTITIIDDASPSIRCIDELKNSKLPIQCIRIEKSGFGGALNAGIKATINPWVCFLNSDCRIESTSWLSDLHETMSHLKQEGVKMVSARMNNGGTGVFDKRLVSPNRFNDKDMITEDSLPLICTLCHRDLFKRIGGYVKEYPWAGYEDEELAWRMKHFGFKQAISGKGWVFHHGGATIKEIKNQKVLQDIEGNRERCLTDIRTLMVKKVKPVAASA